MLTDRFLSMTMVLGIGFLLLISLLLSATMSAVSGYLGAVLPVPAALWEVTNFALSFALVTLLFAMIFKILPDARIEWRHVWLGSLITAALFSIGKFALGVYLSRPETASAYGAAGALVLVMLWIYYSSIILLFGAEFTQAHARGMGHRIEPARHAVRVTELERARQGMPDTEALKAISIGKSDPSA